MTGRSSEHRAITEICQKSQEIMNRRAKEVGVARALADRDPHEQMWKEYTERIKDPVELRQVSFSGLLFAHAKFEKHSFIDCDFSRSRWVFSSIIDGNCTGSNFSGTSTVLCPFRNTDCANCDFTGAEISFFDPFEPNNFENANFSNSKLNTAHSFFKDEKLASAARFENAIMNGCRLTIQKERQPGSNRTKGELRSILEKIFSPDQLAVMHIDYEGRRT